jgi:cell division septum initiation protein DivIVA
MRSGYDLLYTLFEQHLFNALVEEETSDAFLDRVVCEYVRLLSARGTIPHEHLQTIEADLRDEVLEMLRKKTYGHYNLTEFRKATCSSPDESTEHKERRGRRTS